MLIATYAAGTTSATISSLAASTTYSFNLVAANSAGTAATPWVQATTPAVASVALTAPQNLHAVATSSVAAQLSWSAIAGATGYRVYEWNGSQGVLVASLGATATSTTISGLTPGAPSTSTSPRTMPRRAPRLAGSAWSCPPPRRFLLRRT